MIMFALFSSSICTTATVDSFNQSEIVAKSKILIDLLVTRKFNETAASFHIPPDLDSREKQSEIESIAFTLSLLFQEFGVIKSIQFGKREVDSFALTIMSGDETYWGKYNEETFALYFVECTKVQDAIIKFDFVKIEEDVALKSITYGHQRENPFAMQQFEEIANRILTKRRIWKNQNRNADEKKRRSNPDR